MWNLRYITGMWTHTIVGSGKTSFRGLLPLQVRAGLKFLQISGADSRVEKLGRSKWRRTHWNPHLSFSPPAMMTVICRKGWHPPLCCCTCTWLWAWRSCSGGSGGAGGAAELAVNPCQQGEAADQWQWGQAAVVYCDLHWPCCYPSKSYANFFQGQP